MPPNKVQYCERAQNPEALVILQDVNIGRGKRQLAVSIPIADIKRLVAIIMWTENGPHIAMHMQNPDFQLPCPHCEFYYA